MSTQARDEYIKRVKYVAEVEKNKNEGDIQEKTSGGTESSVPSHDGSPLVIPGVRLPIPIPTGDRKGFQEKAAKYAWSIDITNSPEFTTLNPQKFEVYLHGFKGDGYVRKDLAYYLEKLFDEAAPKIKASKFTIESTFRTKEHNDKIYANKEKKVAYSPHCGGLAVDISLFGDNRYIVADIAWKMGFGGIAVGKNFIHVDISVKQTWPYAPTPEYKGPGRWYG